ncbi:Putative Dol-P-Glc:Glc(2)Man(9)GlcNAc(2)-PP-Dol alpha-1,2-glucosyltransferase [Anthophora quadrimaculata]
MANRSSFKVTQCIQKITVPLVCSSVVTLFIYLNRIQPSYYIDEIFHVPQTLQYCAGNFTQWDPKITTLPGLYLIATVILSPLKLYVVSVNAILLMLLLHLHKKFIMAAFVGFLSVIIRQTNIIWVAFVTMERIFDLLGHKTSKSISHEHNYSAIHLRLLWKKITEEISHGWTSFVKFIIHLCVQLFPYVIVCLTFVAFIVWNKGIVVGDKTAHIPTIHISQLLYFSVFLFCFSWPYMIVNWKDYIKFVRKHWIFTGSILGLLTVIVHFNTLVHPYVLADNRHYVFYFWNKFMGKYRLFKYLLVPLYSFTLYTMLHGIKHLRVVTQINYIFMVSAVLIPQLLIEPRYFIMPYILYRFLIVKPKVWQIIAESMTTLIVNFLQFYIFANKVFYWSDQLHPQRISW